jgi:Enoyl-CoA hydratase/isomerase
MINPNETNAVLLEVDERKVASVIFNRPAVNNAYDGDFIQYLLATIDALDTVAGLRAVVVKSNGKHFQAGADLKWLNAVRISSAEENIRASRATAEAVQRLNLAPVATVALVQGACFGGGTGILAACDVVIAADNAIFSIAEVRWGLTAAIIIPQLNDAISVRQVRRYALTWCRSPSWKRPARGSLIKYCKMDRKRSRRPRCWRWNRLGAVWTRRNSTASSKFTRARDSLPKQPKDSCHSWKSARQHGDEVEAFGLCAVLLKSEPLLFGTNSQ